MNIYRLPANAYNRTRENEKTISEDAIKDKLVGQKRKEIIDVIVDKDKMIEKYKAESEVQQ